MPQKYNTPYTGRRDDSRNREDIRSRPTRYDEPPPQFLPKNEPYGYDGFAPNERDTGYPPSGHRGQRWSPDRNSNRHNYRDDRHSDRREPRHEVRHDSSPRYHQRPYESSSRREYRPPNEYEGSYPTSRGRTDHYSGSRDSRREPAKVPMHESDFNRSRPSAESDIIQNSIFLSSLPKDVSVAELSALFGSIGVIQTDRRSGLQKIKIYTNPDGSAKGEASIYYQDAQAARASIEWFDNTEVRGSRIHVQMADRSYSSSYTGRENTRGGRGGFRGVSKIRDASRGERGGDSRGGNKPAFIQPGDWTCASCQNNNFSWRVACNRCQTERTDDPGAGSSEAHRSYSSNTRGSPRRGSNQYSSSSGYQY